jgi:hypothetical protein
MIGMAVIFIAEFDELTIDLYLHGNIKRAEYYHKLICLSYIKDNYICKNTEMKMKIKNFEKVFSKLKRQKDECDRHLNKIPRHSRRKSIV